ncbi:MAG: glycosyltransferase [Clostridium sp.]|uniref:glycosyltransferase n=1 Tax=Clostridium sp. TaxID=1506 RepID=UPI003EE4B224
MKKKEISLCIISKNEENLIRGCIEGAKDIVSEIIVVDTGSKDRTVEIAKEYGAKVYNEEFYYDFAELRNRCIQKATKDWILFLDCDEVLEDKKEILKVLNEITNEVAISLRIGSYLDSIKRSEDNIIRLFKRDEKIKFKGKVYESIEESIKLNYGEEKIKYSNIKVKHYGSDKEKVDLKRKISRNLKILSLMSEDEKDEKYFFDLGNEYGRMEDYDMALEKYEKAFELEKSKKVDKCKLVINKAKAMHKLEMFSDELDFIKENLLEFNDFKDLYFLKCLCEVQMGHFHDAKESIEEYMKKETLIKYPSSEFENAICLEDFYKNISEIADAVNM